jgi:hypothetical protein
MDTYWHMVWLIALCWMNTSGIWSRRTYQPVKCCISSTPIYWATMPFLEYSWLGCLAGWLVGWLTGFTFTWFPILFSFVVCGCWRQAVGTWYCVHLLLFDLLFSVCFKMKQALGKVRPWASPLWRFWDCSFMPIRASLRFGNCLVWDQETQSGLQALGVTWGVLGRSQNSFAAVGHCWVRPVSFWPLCPHVKLPSDWTLDRNVVLPANLS